MKSDKDLLKLMDLFDGISQENPSKEDLKEMNELTEIRDALKKLPTEEPDQDMDKRFYAFLEIQKNEDNNPSLIRRFWPYVALAASVVLVLYIFLPKSLSDRYQELDSNVDKVGFIYALNNENINRSEYLWLVSLLEREKNPNIRITLIDLIAQQQKPLPVSMVKLLTKEEIPTVQMALLNTIDKNYNPEMQGQLLAFNNREDLDQMVKQRIVDILTER